MIQMKVFIIRVFLPSCWWVSCKLWIADKHDHPSQQPPGRAIPPSNGTFPLAYFFFYFPTMFFYRFNNQLSINEFPKKKLNKNSKKSGEWCIGWGGSLDTGFLSEQTFSAAGFAAQWTKTLKKITHIIPQCTKTLKHCQRHNGPIDSIT